MRISVQNFFLWLSGASNQVLLKCPASEQKKYARLGGTVLIPSTVGFFSFIYLSYTVSQNIYLSIIISSIWALVILAIDIAMLSSYRTNLSFGKKITQVLLRLSIAILFGVMISHPVILLLFKDSIKGEIDNHRDLLVKQKYDDLESYKSPLLKMLQEYDKKIDTLNEERKCIITDTYEKKKLSSYDITEPDIKFYQDQISSIENDLTLLEEQRKSVISELSDLQKKYSAEIAGNGESGKSGKGPIAISIEKLINQKEADIALFDSNISNKIAQREELRATIINTREQSKEERELYAERLRNESKNEKNSLLDTNSSQLSAYLKEKQNIEQDIKNAERKFKGFVKREESNRYIDILSQTLALHRIFDSQKSYIPIALYLLLVSLFTLIDTIPIILKFFTKPGPYDIYINSEEKRFEETTERLRNIDGYKMMTSEVDEFVSLLQSSTSEFDKYIELITPHSEKGDEHDHAEIYTSMNTRKAIMVKTLLSLFYEEKDKVISEFFHSYTVVSG